MASPDNRYDGVGISKIKVLSQIKTGENRNVELSITLKVLARDEYEAIAWLLSTLENG